PAVLAAGRAERAGARAAAQPIHLAAGCGGARAARAHPGSAGRPRAGNACIHAGGDVVIRLEDVHKRYGRLDVLKGIDLEFEAGTVTAVAGPNGSGKSTLLRIVLGLVRPDRGRVHFDGRPLDGDWRYRARVGDSPPAAAVPESLTGAEGLALLKDRRGSPEDTDEELRAACALGPELDKPVRTLSTGTRQKVSAAAAFLFRPDVLVLDEPTAGLDP